ncbi:hypothetical protein J6590_044737 [Homalodisca vitripennis]|nr:hypothetical protein J6590_044737 [Homalodisca vitripennis]
MLRIYTEGLQVIIGNRKYLIRRLSEVLKSTTKIIKRRVYGNNFSLSHCLPQHPPDITPPPPGASHLPHYPPLALSCVVSVDYNNPVGFITRFRLTSAGPPQLSSQLTEQSQLMTHFLDRRKSCGHVTMADDLTRLPFILFPDAVL